MKKRTTFYINDGVFKRLKAMLILRNMSVSAWLELKMREELGE